MMDVAHSATARLEMIQGSTSRSFLVAFLFIFCLGTALIVTLLVWGAGIGLNLEYGLEIAVACAGLSAILARLASFQVATSVTTTPQGIEATWRGPFGGHSVQHLLWSEIKSVRVPLFGGTCIVKTGIALKSIEVTLAQARAIVRYPMFPLKELPFRVRVRIGLPA